MIGARDVEGRERLLRCVARPMVASERVSELADGRIAWRRSIPGGRGETHRINGAQGCERDEKPVGAKSSGRIDWATLMQRVWGWDVLACPRCDGRMRFIAVIKARDVIERILTHVGLSTARIVAAPARRWDETS